MTVLSTAPLAHRAAAVSVLWCLVCALAVASAPAGAICWIDREEATTADGFPTTSARVAGMRAAALTINRLLKANPALSALPDVRLRSSWRITGHPDRSNDPYGLRFELRAYSRDFWSGECDLLPHADQAEPVAVILINLNSVDSTLTQQVTSVRDDELRAFVEPERLGEIGEQSPYGGQWIVLTSDGRVPWVPVTMAEYLDFEERRLVQAEAETRAKNDKAWNTAELLDADGIRDTYEGVRQIDPAEAEKLRAMMEDTRRRVESAAQVNEHTGTLAELRALRASLSPDELAGQAREGYISRTPPAPIETLPRLVKLDPGMPWDRNPNRILMMEIHFSGRGAPYDTAMREVAATLDWAALRSLMR
jgi:hypothetical protein